MRQGQQKNAGHTGWMHGSAMRRSANHNGQPSSHADKLTMAVVRDYVSLQRPRPSESKRFADLFIPTFQRSSPQAKAKAIASLSELNWLPPLVVSLISQQPIWLSGVFLTHGKSLNEESLIALLTQLGRPAGRAIAKRADLSASLISQLSALNDPAVMRSLAVYRVETFPFLTKDLLLAFRRGERRQHMEILADFCTVPMPLAASVLRDRSGRALAILLRSTGMAGEDAAQFLWSAFALDGRHSVPPAPLALLIERLETERCQTLVSGWATEIPHRDNQNQPVKARIDEEPHLLMQEG